mmetsp:Transcript_29250/g.28343  ORF Transcript_29250/g.28343 Transcript_29250/m.28343 type:complete len:214 (+) Transcript_29250:378-1019(+)
MGRLLLPLAQMGVVLCVPVAHFVGFLLHLGLEARLVGGVIHEQRAGFLVQVVNLVRELVGVCNGHLLGLLPEPREGIVGRVRLVQYLEFFLQRSPHLGNILSVLVGLLPDVLAQQYVVILVGSVVVWDVLVPLNGPIVRHQLCVLVGGHVSQLVVFGDLRKVRLSILAQHWPPFFPQLYIVGRADLCVLPGMQIHFLLEQHLVVHSVLGFILR